MPDPRDRRSNKRRQTDRRWAARRGGDHALGDESLFDALGVGQDSGMSSDTSGWRDGIDPPRSGRLLSRQATQVVWQGASTFERLYETFIGGRAALGIALLMAQVWGWRWASARWPACC
jgi:hypothetical protein